MEIPEVDVSALAEAREEGAPVLDVRQPDEYEEGHVPGAVLIPLDQLPDRLDEVPSGDGALYVVCRSGGRSRKAAEFLRPRSIDAVNVAGGTLAWIEAGQPTITGSERE